MVSDKEQEAYFFRKLIAGPPRHRPPQAMGDAAQCCVIITKTISPGSVTGHASASGLFPANVEFLNREVGRSWMAWPKEASVFTMMRGRRRGGRIDSVRRVLRKSSIAPKWPVAPQKALKSPVARCID
ncbi:hypothetical protein [Bradyrhizobium oligotrophicum]|uniref:hypothetical protein n=1 Tax=Bradyrhizobium oligotrophicum TaxID=44255 RepID=UPI003EC056E7